MVSKDHATLFAIASGLVLFPLPLAGRGRVAPFVEFYLGVCEGAQVSGPYE